MASDNMEIETTDTAALKHELHSAVLGQKWDYVVEIFKEHPEIQATKITKSKDTALHVAVSLDAPENIVVKLVDEIEKNTEVAMETLAAKNNQEDTPLHYAASRGSPTICKSIIRVNEVLVCKRNVEGETPLFLAALNGHKQTFLYLHSVCCEMDTNMRSSLWRRKNGDTILHCTIQREYFDLALHIIHLYDDQRMMASFKNKEGITPLHALASNPTAFKSGTRLFWWQKLCYNYIGVEELKIDPQIEGHVLDVGNYDLMKAADTPLVSHQTQGSIRKMKEKHVWGAQIMEELLKRNSEYDYYENEESRVERSQQGESSKKDKKSTALLVATKYGLSELVNRILEVLPVAINDKTEPKKRNMVLLAIEKRQTHVLKSLMQHPLWQSLREAVDVDGNNVLHMASFLLEHMPREIHGSVMQMQYEAKWFKYVKENMPPYLSVQENKDGYTPDEIFAEKHKELLKESNEWLKDTSGSYSVVAALTAGATYATSYTVLGGTDDTTGKPILEGRPAFNVFVVSILISFCLSITSLAAFMAVFSSRKQPIDYLRSLPLKLCFGLTSFYLSIVSMLISFCAALSFELDHRIKHKISPYGLILIPLCFYTYAQIPLYLNLLRTTFAKEPEPRYVGDNVTM